jgi:hypothetical protein
MTYQIRGIRLPAIIDRVKVLTSKRLLAWIIKPWALICQLVPMTERVNPSESKLFDIVACPKTGVA